MPLILRSSLAEQDFREIWIYIAQDNPDAADNLLRLIEKKLELYSFHPAMGTDRSNLLPCLFSFSVGNYLVFYHSIENGIELVRVLHGSRQFKRLLNPRLTEE